MRTKILDLLEQAKEIKASESQYSALTGEFCGVTGPKTLKWLTDIYALSGQLPDSHPLKSEIKKVYSHKGMTSTFDRMHAILQTLGEDDTLILKVSEHYNKKSDKIYDVFLSHASKDKSDYVEELKQTLDILGIDVFYDKDTIEWGDEWKKKIYEGLKKSEFAIIVISENFFDREWTELELKTLLERQNDEGQKLILPILHNITTEQLRDKYPTVADIQAIESGKNSTEKIALLFAKQLIKRYK